MKTLQQLREKANMGIAQDYVAPKDEDDEATKAKYRAKGEQDFADSHKVIKTKHPVADDDQFDGNTKFAGKHEKPEGNGEKNVVKQGSSDAKGSAHDGAKKPDDSKAARKRVGDLMAVKQGSSKISEEYMDESVMDDLKKIVSSRGAKRIKFKNGKTEMVDSFSASAITQVYEKVNKQNQKKMEKMAETSTGFLKLMDFAMSKAGGR